MSKPTYDVAYHWTRGDKTGWTTIGHAFVNDGGRIRISLGSLPVPGIETNPGELTLFPSVPVKKVSA